MASKKLEDIINEAEKLKKNILKKKDSDFINKVIPELNKVKKVKSDWAEKREKLGQDVENLDKKYKKLDQEFDSVTDEESELSYMIGIAALNNQKLENIKPDKTLFQSTDYKYGTEGYNKEF